MPFVPQIESNCFIYWISTCVVICVAYWTVLEGLTLLFLILNYGCNPIYTFLGVSPIVHSEIYF